MPYFILATVLAAVFGLGYSWAAFPNRKEWYARYLATGMACLASVACTACHYPIPPSAPPPDEYHVLWSFVAAIIASRTAWRLLHKFEPDSK